jgi:hypothetical protein
MSTTLTWVTSSGSLGTIPEGIFYQTNIQANADPVANVTYTVIAGSLPTGITLNANTGNIGGTPTATIVVDGVVIQVSDEITSKFSVRARAYNGNTVVAFSDRTFSFTVSGESTPFFITPAGSIATLLDANLVPNLQIQFSDNDPNDIVTAKIIDGQLPPGLSLSPSGSISGYILPLNPTRIPINSISGNGTVVTVGYNTQILTPFGIGSYVTIAGIVPANSGYNGTFVTSTVSNSSVTYSSNVTTANVNILNASITSAPKTFFITGIDSNSNANITTVSFVTQDYPPYQVPQLITLTDVSPSALNNTFVTTNCTVNSVSFAGYYANTAFTGNVSLVTGINLNEQFQFTVEITDGKTQAIRNFSILVLNNSTLTADNTYITADNTDITADASSAYTPVILNPEGSIGSVPNDIYFAYLFTGFSSAPEAVQYEVLPKAPPDPSLPPNLVLDQTTGWLYGYIPPLGLTSETFDFSIRPFYVANNVRIDGRYFDYSLTVEGNITEQIFWVTPSDLGSIDNGQISQLFVLAQASDPMSTSIGTLFYRLQSGAFNQLPPGTQLLDDGLIIGRVAFNIPGDLTCTFTVEAYNLPGPGITPVSIFRTFTVLVKQEYLIPYENIYIKAMPPLDDRAFLQALLTDTEIFEPELIYRPEDPNFGVASSVVYWHAYGILPGTRQEYLNAMLKNHYWKELVLGQIKTAQSRDDLGVVTYDVVYAEVVDNLINNQGVSVGSSVVLPYPLNTSVTLLINNITQSNVTPQLFTVTFPEPSVDLYPPPLPPYVNGQEVVIADVVPNDFNGNIIVSNVTTGSFTFTANIANVYVSGGTTTGANPYPISVVYPNSLEDMRNQIVDSIGQVPRSSNVLPSWMYSRQADGGVLGFTPAWVLAYTKPGQGDRIAYNLQRAIGNQLNLIDFKVDRYEIDKQSTYNFDPVTDQWIPAVPTFTTFDIDNHYEIDFSLPLFLLPGTGYVVDDILTVSGNQIGGVSPNNNMTIRVNQTFNPIVTPTTITGNGVAVTVFYATLETAPYRVGQQIIITNSNPNVYNGNHIVTDCQRTQLTFTSNVSNVYVGNAVVTGVNTGAIANVFATGTAPANTAGNSYANVPSVSAGLGTNATFWITTVPGNVTIFDQGSMQFTDGATPYITGDEFDEYRVFPHRTILEADGLLAINWLNNNESAVNWTNTDLDIVYWVN